jgi:neutral trehalase
MQDALALLEEVVARALAREWETETDKRDDRKTTRAQSNGMTVQTLTMKMGMKTEEVQLRGRSGRSREGHERPLL